MLARFYREIKSQIEVYGMINKKLYAVLVGIDQYPIPVPNLNACKKDVHRMVETLRSGFSSSAFEPMILLDEKATKSNIIKAFRNHLSKTRKGELALFYFSGHGSRQATASAFLKEGLSPDGFDETLVCYDSRSQGGQDLADKEMAVLLEELWQHRPRIICIFDCCHSASLTRHSKSELPEFRPRFSPPNSIPPPLSAYLDGHFSRQRRLAVPEAPHISLSACQRNQIALEENDRGLFTHYLTQTWKEKGLDQSMGKMLQSIKLDLGNSLQQFNLRQDPQLEVYSGIFPNSTLFTGKPIEDHRLARLFRSRQTCYINLGGLEGVKKGQSILMSKCLNEKRLEATVLEVGPEISRLQLNTDWNDKTVWVRTSFPNLPLKAQFEVQGSDFFRTSFDQALEQTGVQANFRGLSSKAPFQLTENKGVIHLRSQDAHFQTNLAQVPNHKWASKLSEILFYCLRWHNGLHLQSDIQSFEEFDFFFSNPSSKKNISTTNWTVSIPPGKSRIGIQVRGRNRGELPCYATLLYFSHNFGIHTFPPVPVPPNSEDVVLFGGAPDQFVYLPKHMDSNKVHLRLLVSSRKPDWHLIFQAQIQNQHPRQHKIPTNSHSNDVLNLTEWSAKKLSLYLTSS